MDNNINLSFLIVGAAKSGTTFLANYLNRHPDIFLPTTELRFFSNVKDINGLMSDFFTYSFVRTKEDYAHFFKNTKKSVLGEKSPCYLYYYEESIKNIKKHFGSDIKIIILLRNPIERALSQYKHSRKYGYENVSFEEALQLESQRKKDNWYYIFLHKEVGLYYDAVKAYKENFKNLKVYITEDFRKNQDLVMTDIYDFLGVDFFKAEETGIERNEGKVYKNSLDKIIFENNNFDYIYNLFLRYIEKYQKIIPSKVFNFIIKKENFMSFFNNYKENIELEDFKMDPAVKKQLVDFYTEDILKTEKLLNMDLKMWLK